VDYGVHLKERKKFEDYLIKILEQSERVIHSAGRRLPEAYDPNSIEKTMKEFDAFEHKINKNIMNYNKLKVKLGQCSKALRERQHNIVNHVKSSSVTYSENPMNSVLSYPSFKIQEAVVSKIESDLNILLNYMADEFQSFLSQNEFTLEQIQGQLRFTQLIKNSAESILNLGIGLSVINRDKDKVRINPFKTVQSNKDFNFQNVVSNVSNDLIMNKEMINKIIELTKALNIKELTNLLIEIQTHEKVMTMRKEFDSYENKVLKNLLDENMKGSKSAERELKTIMSEIGDKKGEKLFACIERIDELNTELQEAKIKDQRVKLRKDIHKEINKVRDFVASLFELPSVSKAQERLEYTMKRLKNQRYLLTPINASSP